MSQALWQSGREEVNHHTLVTGHPTSTRVRMTGKSYLNPRIVSQKLLETVSIESHSGSGSEQTLGGATVIVVVETEVVVEMDVETDTVVDHFVIVFGGIVEAVSLGCVQISPLGNVSVVEVTVQVAQGGESGGLLGMLMYVRWLSLHETVVWPLGPTVKLATVALG